MRDGPPACITQGSPGVAEPTADWAQSDRAEGNTEPSFGCSERDSIRLLHKFGAILLHDALSLPRAALLAQLEEIRSGAAYTAFLRQRQQVAQKLAVARAEHVAHQHRIRGGAEFRYGKSLADLPPGVHLAPGRIFFDFTHPEDFWAMVDTLADIAAQDPESFAKASAALEPI